MWRAGPDETQRGSRSKVVRRAVACVFMLRKQWRCRQPLRTQSRSTRHMRDSAPSRSHNYMSIFRTHSRRAHCRAPRSVCTLYSLLFTPCQWPRRLDREEHIYGPHRPVFHTHRAELTSAHCFGSATRGRHTDLNASVTPGPCRLSLQSPKNVTTVTPSRPLRSMASNHGALVTFLP